jgi:acetyltransferase-like isoleucine patch superfamily enzyme
MSTLEWLKAQMAIHSTAIVESGATIGENTHVWHFAHIRAGAKIGAECIIGKDAYIDTGVVIGDRCKIQNGVSVYNGVILEDDVFVGPHVAFTNDLTPRAFGPWEPAYTTVKKGASLGAHSTILANIVIGEYAMIAAGAVVTRSVPTHTLVCGNPARIMGYVCKQGHTMPDPETRLSPMSSHTCPICLANNTMKRTAEPQRHPHDKYYERAT